MSAVADDPFRIVQMRCSFFGADERLVGHCGNPVVKGSGKGSKRQPKIKRRKKSRQPQLP
jgi:hypothetical protein